MPALQEKEPMGTAGPLALAHEILNDGSGDPFFVLNRCAGGNEPVKYHTSALGLSGRVPTAVWSILRRATSHLL